MAQLRVTSSNLQGAVYALAGEYFTVGRETDNTVQISHSSISKHHAMLTVDKDDFILRDLHSTNGIIVNGEKTVIRHLKDGDRVILGEVELRFEINGSTPVKPPEPPASDQRQTQRMSILPPPPTPPAKPVPPPATPRAIIPVQPVAVVTPVQLPAPPKPAPATAAVAATTPVIPATAPIVETAKTRTGLFSKLLRHRPAPPKPESAPPPAREEIRAGLEKTLTANGMTMPSQKTQITQPVYSPPRRFPAVEEAEPPVAFVTAPEPLPLVTHPPPAQRNYRRLIFTLILIVGLILLGIGYSANALPLKFFGIITSITGFITLVFALRFGSIIAPPR